MSPAVGESRLAVRTLLHLRQAGDPSNVILHQHGKSRTAHCGSHNTAKKLLCEIDLVIFFVNAPHKQPTQINGSLEDGSALFHCDAVRHVPGELLDGADQTFIRPLWALPGER